MAHSSSATKIWPASRPTHLRLSSDKTEKTAPRPRILVVDDEVNICKSLRRFLRLDGYDVLEALSGREALQVLEGVSGQVQIVLSDLNMPGGMDGIALLKAIRDQYPQVRRILLTAFGDPSHLVEAINEAGVHRFLPKPWDGKVMLDTLRESVEQWHALSSREEVADLVRQQRDALRSLTEQQQDLIARRTHNLETVTRRWRQTLDSINDPLTLIDRDYRIQRANKAAARAAKAHIKDLNGKRCHAVLFGRDTPCARCPMGQVTEGLDEPLTVEITDERTGQLWEVNSWPLDAEMEAEMGQYVCHYRDVTESKALERRALMAEKMAAVGELAGCVAHELNNPLTGILSFSQIMQRKLGEDHKLGPIAGDIEAQARRCRNIVQSLLDFARPGASPTTMGAIDVDELVRTCAQMASLKSAVKLAFEAPADLWQVWGNIDGMKSVFLNLFNNAVHAMERCGELTVVAENHRGDEGLQVRLQVYDTGPGIPEGIREQVFTPFFTTKAANKGGTGLGLSIVKNMIEDHGGSVSLIDGPTTGACFDIYLPAKSINQGSGL